MLWPGAVYPPDLCRGVVTSLGERTGVQTSARRKVPRQRYDEEHFRLRGMLLPCPCSGFHHMDSSLKKQRPKTQWYIKVGHSDVCYTCSLRNALQTCTFPMR